MPLPNVQRILLIKPDHLGDLLLATPALRWLRQTLPSARITALVGPWSSRIWLGNPDLDELIELPFPGFERLPVRRRSLRPYVFLLKTAYQLRRGAYDAALLLRDDHWWGAALATLAAIPQRIGHAHPRCRPFLTTALPYDPREHVTRQALAVVAALTRVPLPPEAVELLPTRFMPTPAEVAWAAAWHAEHCTYNQRLIVLHPGTAGLMKQWLPRSWVVVADALSADPRNRLLLTGGSTELELVNQIANALNRPLLSLVGQTTIGQLTALFGHADLVVGLDSGPLHLAVSQGRPTLHLFGPSDQLRFGPWGSPERHQVLNAAIACSPCGIFTSCKLGTIGPECMDAISPYAVIAAAQRLLAVAAS